MGTPPAPPGRWRALAARGGVSLVLGLVLMEVMPLALGTAIQGRFLDALVMAAVAAAISWALYRQVRAMDEIASGKRTPDGPGWLLLALAGGAALWFIVFLAMCLPYFMRPFTLQKERKAAIEAKVPEAARLEALDGPALAAATRSLIAALADADQNTRAGARAALARVAGLPEAPAGLLVPALVAEMEREACIPSTAADALTRLGAPGKKALVDTLSGPGSWAPDAAAFALGRLQPPPLDALPALEAALASAPSDRKTHFRLAIERIQGKRP